MNLNDFTKALSASLVERGVPEEAVRLHITRLIPTLSEEDLREIASFTSAEEFRDISDATAAMLIQTSSVRVRNVSSVSTPRPVTEERKAPLHEKKGTGYRETPEGKQRFILITLCASPLFALAFILYFALWGVAFGAQIGAIAFSICALIAFATGGVASAIGGVIYGIVTLSSVPSAGIYEIGFGIVILGVTFLACILIYNFAIRFLPFAIRKTAELFVFCFGKVRELLSEYRRRCYTK